MIAFAAIAALLFCLVLIADLARARMRLRRWPMLAPVECAPADDLHFFAAPGVVVDDRLRREAAACLRDRRLDVLDLVPADLGVGEALELAAITDPALLESDRFARIAGAGHLLAVRADVLARAALDVPTDAPAIAAAAEMLRRFAVGRTGSVLAPSLRAVPEAAADRAAMLRARTGAGAGPTLYVQGIRWGLLLTALLADVRVGLAAFVCGSILPTLAFVGLPLCPRDRFRSLVQRLPRDLAAWLRRCLQPDPRRTAAVAAARPEYAELLRSGTAPFFAARRARCPICGADRLATRINATDLLQRKPGRFVLDQCAGCGIVFQNPPLSVAGLEFYYRDFYDGLSADFMDDVFASTRALYAARATAVAASGPAPSRWLDVGCGHAHFSLEASRQLPATRFEGLDRSASVDEAAARRWIAHAWRQSTADLADAGERFDIVSLFHYLEHTQDPAAEILAAARLLTPGGRVILEIPNPRCRLGGWLGRWWFPWFQPQHQFLLDEGAVRRLLAAADLDAIAVSYLTTAGDLLLGTMLAVNRVCSAGDVPWAPRPGYARRMFDLVLWGFAFPLLATALVADAIYELLPASPLNSNALRVLAARRADTRVDDADGR
jgi:ubiquinone/menaquinone biosynthesis C-methylase UbiE